jgi:rhodanese-related sulfurtransferase
MKKLYIILSIVVFLVFSAFVYAYSQEEEIANISVGDLIEWMSGDEAITILDVRNPEELVGELGHIKGVVNIPVHDLEKRIAEMEQYKEHKIAVICRSGNRSKYGTAVLSQNGFKAFNVVGGMRAYRKVISK